LTAKLLKSIWPVAGGAIAFAAIAGVFLSLSGLISGYFDNKVIARNIQARLVEHPMLKRFLSLSSRTKLATYLCDNLGALSGNISLGFFLGMAGFLGFITGLPIDIRHIAFSSANFGFAFLPSELTTTEVVLGALSILLIGAINFAVSFGITLYLTLKSRGISFVNTFKLLLFLLKETLLKPWTFLFAPPR
jgi:site-specific recombinase